MTCVMRELDEKSLKRSTVVFSPHFDDETLGCGGTILKKKNVGADVKIVFMTDGSKSHSHLISEDELKSIRAHESLAASQVLGLHACDVFFLGFEERVLSEHLASAVNKVAGILCQQQPEEIFVPYYKDRNLDHVATNKIVTSALQMWRGRAIIYEYPVWFWHHWPWVSPPVNSFRRLLSVWKNSIISGLYFLRDFRWAVGIGDVLEHKRTALNQYKSQMTRLMPDPRWLTLQDVANGEFLECFLQEYEIFHRYSFLGKN